MKVTRTIPAECTLLRSGFSPETNDSFINRRTGRCYGLGGLSNLITYTAWKVSVFGVILVCIFPHSD